MEEIRVQYGDELTSNAFEEALEKEIEQHGEQLEGNACEEALEEEIEVIDLHGEKLEDNACEDDLEKEIDRDESHTLLTRDATIGIGSRLLASGEESWVSDNGTFAFGFTPSDTQDRFLLGIWFAQLPGDQSVVW